MYTMVAVLAKKLDVPGPELLKAFGKHLFVHFDDTITISRIDTDPENAKLNLP